MKGKCAKTLGGVAVLGMCISTAFGQGFGSFDYDTDVFRDIEQQRGLPIRGMSSKSVLSQYGEPDSRTGPVGDPPISTWYYQEFNVYFEHHLVITTVAGEDRLPTKLKGIQE